MAWLTNRIVAALDPGPARFAALADAGRLDEAERLARRVIRRGLRPTFYLKRLLEMRSAAGDHRAVLALWAEFAGAPALSAYAMQVIHATALIETGEPEAARTPLLRLICDHPYVVPLRLYRRLPSGPGTVDMAVAAFRRSLRPHHVRTLQAMNLVDVMVAAGETARAADTMVEVMRASADGAAFDLPKRKRFMSRDDGDAALVDLHDLLTPTAPFFLISGTLLGVVREGRLLGADKDIDVGVLGADSRDEIRRLAAGSKSFTEIYVPSVDYVKLAHRTGVKIDVFLHHAEDGVVWHGSHLHAWDNTVWWEEGASPFATVEYAGRQFLVPSDPDRYLTDNYGDWRTPQGDYDAALEAPNRRIRDPDVVRVHWRKRIVSYHLDGQFVLLAKAFEHYRREFGADAFLREAARLYLLREIGDGPQPDVDTRRKGCG